MKPRSLDVRKSAADPDPAGKLPPESPQRPRNALGAGAGRLEPIRAANTHVENTPFILISR